MQQQAPATSKEKSLWLLEDLVPGAGVNNLSFTFQADGALDAAALRSALAGLLRRHEVLRTVFVSRQDGDEATLLRSTRPADESIVDIETVARRDGDDVVAELTAFVGVPFRADGGALLRARHVTHPDGDFFCLAVHHSIYDGMSTVIVVDEFSALYDAAERGAAVPAELTAPVPRWTEPTPAPAVAEFWREQVAGLDASALGLWCEKPLPAKTTLVGDWVTRRLSPEATAVAKRLQRELRAPEVVVLMAAYYVLLAAHGSGPDITVGSPVSVRDREHQRSLGYHINVLTLRQQVAPERTFRDLVTGLRKNFFATVGQAGFPVDELLEIVPRVDASWRNSLFRHVFNYIPDSDPVFPFGGGKARLLTIENGYSKFDLEFFLTVSGDSLQVRAAFYEDAFARVDVELLVDRYEAILLALGDPQVADGPLGEIAVWSARDHAVIDGANATERPLPYASVLEAVAEQVATRPDAVALREGERAVSYAQLWDAAWSVAHELRAADTHPGSTVALLCRRGAALAASVLGTWLVDAVYLPLDPDHPTQRIEYQLADSGAAVVIADAGVTVPAEDVVLLQPPPISGATAGTALPQRPTPGAPAYVIYTSGSTGRPKGTVISHHNLANLIAHFADELGGDGATLWMTTFSFDISALELFLPLVAGGTVVVAPDAARVDGDSLLDVLAHNDIDLAQATPTTWRLVGPQEVGSRLAGRRVLSGGEPLPPQLARQLLATGAELTNVYGPTETTIWSTSGRITDLGADGRVHVGAPIANTKIFVAAPDGRELPIGVRGEMCIAGEGVAVGYHERPDLNAERFGTHPSYGRFYRTGDLARWQPDGTLEVLGRMDRQVKLRGNRIELAEVETVLVEHPQVSAAAVVLVGDPTTDGALVAFVVAPDERRVVDELWSHARTLLQGAAVPQDFIPIAAFPMTGNDKVNYPELARIAQERRARTAGGEANAGDTAATGDEIVDALTELWRELLENPALTGESHFFTSGGHSLLGARLLQRIDQTIGIRLKLADLFANPTPRVLAEQARARLNPTEV